MHEIAGLSISKVRITISAALNLDFAEWGDAFPANRMLGAATLDRLRHGAYRIVLEAESYRAPKPLPESPKAPARSSSAPKER
jgi:DNA replication protein DnaC